MRDGGLGRSVWVVVAACAIGLTSAAGARSATKHSESPAHVRLPGHDVAALSDATPVGPSAGDTAPLALTFVLKRDDQAGFERYLREVYDPKSPRHRSFLTPREIADRFGPSTSAYDRVLRYARKRGFELVEGSANRLTLTVRGTRRAAERMLDVRIGDYQLGETRFHANDLDPTLPRELARHVQTIAGLSDLARPRPQIKAILSSEGNLICGLIALACFERSSNYTMGMYKKCVAAVQAAIAAGSYHIPFLFTEYTLPAVPVDMGELTCAGPEPPPALRAAPAAAGLSPRGVGQKIGLVAFDTFDQNDIADYVTLTRTPPSRLAALSRVPVNGGAPAGAHQDEVLLDIVIALTVAPAASVTVYDAPFQGAGTFQAVFNAMINDGVTVISNSWAYCENETTAADVQSIDAIFQTAAASGISVFNASGDTGSTCLNGAANTIAVPAGSPNATAVGGSSLATGPAGERVAETWWNGAGDVPPTGQGGFGVSRFFTRPSYQDGFTSEPNRSIPDVVANADPASGIMICQQSKGGCPSGAMYGGTSAAAPIWAGFAANLNQALGQNVGFFNPRLYPLANTDAFFGPAAMGSDFAHVGLGSPNTDAILRALGNQPLGPVSPTLSFFYGALDVFSPGPGPVVSGVPADGTSKGYLVVQLRDANGRFVAGKTVSVTPSPTGSAVVTPASGVSAVDGTVVFTITNTVVETLTFSATADGVPLAETVTAAFEVPFAAGGGIQAFPTIVTANGVDTTTITVTLQDALGRPTPGKEVLLSQGGGHSIITAPSPTVTDVNGQIQFTATNTTNETVTYTAVDVTDGELDVPVSAQVTFNDGTGAACGNTVVPPTGANGWTITPYLGGFASGPLLYGGINFGPCAGAASPAFRDDDVFAVSFFTGDLFKLPAVGGSVSTANKLATHGPTLSAPAIGKDGRIYASRVATTGNFTTGAIFELDPDTGAIVRPVVSNLYCPSPPTVDPLSGDLFFTSPCFGTGADDPRMYRVRDPGGASPAVETYATLPQAINGLPAFAPNGTIYVVTGYTSPDPPVVRVTGTNGPTPPTVTPIDGLRSNYWVNIGDVDANGEARSLVLLDFDELKLVNITTTPPTETVIANDIGGGVVGPDGCLYTSNGIAVFKLTDPTGGCSFAASNPGLSLTPASVSPNPAQGSARSFTASFRNLQVPAGTAVFFAVSGANQLVRMVRTNATGQATFEYTATKAGKDVVVATATVNDDDIVSNKARVTWDPGKQVTFLTLNPSPTSGVPGTPVNLAASLSNNSVIPPTGIAGAAITFALGAAQCGATTDASGLAGCQLTPDAIGSTTLDATFAGTADLAAASASVGFEVTCPADLDGVACYLAVFKTTLEAASADDVKKAVRRGLLKKVKKLGKLVTKSRQEGKRGEKARKKLGKQLDALARKVERLSEKKMAATLKSTLAGLSRSARSRVPAPAS